MLVGSGRLEGGEMLLEHVFDDLVSRASG
ncbi:MAG: hypothetical protein QOH55_1291, partial [Microbacteriaceae bacterium]|nr:hypothetical protein [Microbacteriaceae bacterium]